MSYPLIILGVGASHDYTIARLQKAPLTDGLLNEGDFSSEISVKYKEVLPLFADMRPIISKKKKTFEECLKDVRGGKEQDVYVKRKLISVAFYLRDFFEEFSGGRGFDPANNYCSLADKIKSDCRKRACIVNFNYDTLFEKSVMYKKW